MPTHEEQVLSLQEAGVFPRDYDKAKLWYENFVASKLNEIRNGEFAREVLQRLPTWSLEYSTRFRLLTEGNLTELKFLDKPFDSVVNKLYRQVILSGQHSRFENCFAEFNDLIRLTLVSPFGDGPKFLAGKFGDLGNELTMNPAIKERANEFGYYAIHFTYDTEVGILEYGSGEPISVGVTAELQLTTQLQSTLRDLTHELYEVRRLREESQEWRWNFEHELFRPSYTGHTLHLLESLILDMKNESEKRDRGL